MYEKRAYVTIGLFSLHSGIEQSVCSRNLALIFWEEILSLCIFFLHSLPIHVSYTKPGSFLGKAPDVVQKKYVPSTLPLLMAGLLLACNEVLSILTL